MPGKGPERVIGIGTGTGLFSPAAGLYHERMRIACPACAATYDVPDERLAPGRLVRCMRCGADWAPLAMVAAPVAAPQPLPEPEPPPSMPPPAPVALAPQPEPRAPEPRTRRPSRGNRPLALAWLLSLAVLAAGAWLAVNRRPDVVSVWPASERAYMALGLSDRH